MVQCDVLCGGHDLVKASVPPFSDLVCDFLDTYSSALRHDDQAKQYPDIQTFAFWARKANIQKLKDRYRKSNGEQFRLGRGIVFHIAPSNVPVNFMYSYAFGLLAGNSNIVRVPSKQFPQITCMCNVLNTVLDQEIYRDIQKRTLVVRYERSREHTDHFSKMCNLRIIWGGDDTIRAIRQSELPPRSTEITFADRYSFGIIALSELKKTADQHLEQLAEKFYNDTYLMDQNACSTPHLIIWKTGQISSEEADEQKKRFWLAVERVSAKYDLPDMKASEKYGMLCEKIAENLNIRKIFRYNTNRLFVCDMDQIGEIPVTELRGRYGLFFQCNMSDWNDLYVMNHEKIQTCAYFGMDPCEILKWISDNHIVGIDRIVPFGSTLDIDVEWDGHDLIREMSRCIITR